MADSINPELDQLRRENARLIGRLEAHGIAWRSSEHPQWEPPSDSAQPVVKTPGSAEQKVALFRRLFRGRGDVYALRWQSRSSGRSGYAPACANEWQPGVCEKPRISCRDCHHRMLLPLTDAAFYGHLAGDHTLGLYPLLENDTCHLLAVDFDEQDWRDDARAFLPSCQELAVPAALEISRSGEGAHVWVFFEEAVPARADRLYVERPGLPQPLLNRLIRLAAFANPAFYKAQAMRLSLWDKPRVIGCAENFPQHIALPRGCLEPALALLQELGIGWELVDERQNGSPLELAFTGQLRADQETAVEAMLRHDIGVPQAPTAFGKTVVAAAILARRGVNTLVLEPRAELLRQWQERLQAFLEVAPEAIGCIGGGKAKPTGQLDIAVMQSLVRKGEVNPVVQRYGKVIVDECHHIAAASFGSGGCGAIGRWGTS